MNLLGLSLSLALGAAPPAPPPEAAVVARPAPAPVVTAHPYPAHAIVDGQCVSPGWDECACEAERGLFRSDRAFENFSGPTVTNPINGKEARSSTYAKFLYVQNVIPGSNPVLQGGNFHIFALQVNVALSERLTFIADKDGYAAINLGNNALANDGWLNIAAGLKYTFLRDVEGQRLAAAGFMFEPTTGETQALARQGSGLFTTFVTYAQEVGCRNYVLLNAGYQFPTDRVDNSSYFYTSLHLDRQVAGWLYPLVEVNWYRYTAGGNRGLPPATGEGDGLINLGTTGVAGLNLVTGAVGLRAVVGPHLTAGAAWEIPLSNRQDGIIDNRLTADLIFRY